MSAVTDLFHADRAATEGAWTDVVGARERAVPLAPLPVPFALVAGGKGGVGKSTLAANLAVQLAREGRRVLLVDLDLGLGDLRVLLRLPAGPTSEDALAGRAPLERCVVRGPAGVDVLPAASGAGAMAHLAAPRRAWLFRELARVAAGHDVVIGDGPAGVGPDVLAFAGAADQAWVVTTAALEAITDAYGLVKALHAWGLETGREVPTPELVVNFAEGLEEARATAARLRTVCEEFLSRSPRTGAWLPRSRAVAASGRAQRPFALDRPDTLENGCLRRLSGRIARRLDAAPAAIRP